MFSTRLEAQLVIADLDDDENDEESKTPQKSCFRSPLHAWTSINLIFFGIFGLRDVEW